MRLSDLPWLTVHSGHPDRPGDGCEYILWLKPLGSWIVK